MTERPGHRGEYGGGVTSDLAGRRILIIGASSGIGRSLGLQAASRGASVAFAARRGHRVREAAKKAGGGAMGLVCDVRDPESCQRVVKEASEGLGGLDVVVYSTAVDTLIRLESTDADVWRATFDTNVIGAALITAAALPIMRETSGRFVYVSASSVDRPLPGMGVYASSKAALETMVRAWQAEHPDVFFATVRVGSALGTEVTSSWDRQLLGELSALWNALGYVHDNGPGGPMTVDQAAASIIGVLDSPVWLREVTAVSDPHPHTNPPGQATG